MTDKAQLEVLNPELQITPDTKIAEMLKGFPQLEYALTEMSESFSKLRNPFLRKTIAKVTSLRQAAKIAEIPLGVLINTLRNEAGMDPLHIESESSESSDQDQPEWFDWSKIAVTLDARQMLENGEHPLNQVIEETSDLESGQIYQLSTPFLPAPLLDVIKSKGFEVWSQKVDDQQFNNYFLKN